MFLKMKNDAKKIKARLVANNCSHDRAMYLDILLPTVSVPGMLAAGRSDIPQVFLIGN
jgi:hypothetical protein